MFLQGQTYRGDKSGKFENWPISAENSSFKNKLKSLVRGKYHFPLHRRICTEFFCNLCLKLCYIVKNSSSKFLINLQKIIFLGPQVGDNHPAPLTNFTLAIFIKFDLIYLTIEQNFIKSVGTIRGREQLFGGGPVAYTYTL